MPTDEERIEQLADTLDAAFNVYELNRIIFDLMPHAEERNASSLLLTAAWKARKRFPYSDQELGVQAQDPEHPLPPIHIPTNEELDWGGN